MENKTLKNMELTVIMPALNEEKNIAGAIENTLKALDDCNISGEIIVIDDGSGDNTAKIVKDLSAGHPEVRMISHHRPKGIGLSFWDGVEHSKADIVVMLPGDNENDPWEIFRYFRLLEHVDIVIPFLFNREVRSIFRNALSFVYRFIINSTFMVNFNYTNGTILYRKSILKELNYHSKGFFFQTDILIRTVKKGYLFAEVPYRLDMRKGGISKAVSFPSLLKVVRGYLRLVKDCYFNRKKRTNVGFSPDSLTVMRRNHRKV